MDHDEDAAFGIAWHLTNRERIVVGAEWARLTGESLSENQILPVVGWQVEASRHLHFTLGFPESSIEWRPHKGFRAMARWRFPYERRRQHGLSVLCTIRRQLRDMASPHRLHGGAQSPLLFRPRRDLLLLPDPRSLRDRREEPYLYPRRRISGRPLLPRSEMGPVAPSSASLTRCRNLA